MTFEELESLLGDLEIELSEIDPATSEWGDTMNEIAIVRHELGYDA